MYLKGRGMVEFEWIRLAQARDRSPVVKALQDLSSSIQIGQFFINSCGTIRFSRRKKTQCRGYSQSETNGTILAAFVRNSPSGHH
jgi:hypothetical protein